MLLALQYLLSLLLAEAHSNLELGLFINIHSWRFLENIGHQVRSGVSSYSLNISKGTTVNLIYRQTVFLKLNPVLHSLYRPVVVRRLGTSDSVSHT